MYELIQVGERSYYIDCPAKIGVYRESDTDVYIIDSGSDKDAGRKVKKVLEEQGWKLKGIINTHSHADHIGGNKYLQQQYGCKIFAPGLEAAFTSSTLLEPMMLYGGFPAKDLRHKFLMAQESDVMEIALNDNHIPDELEIIPLKGHSFDMIGIRTPDNVAYIADCVSSKATLDKYGIPFIYDPEEYKKTLFTIQGLGAKVYIPAHAEVCEDITELAGYNLQKVLEIEEMIKKMLGEPMSFEALLKGLFDEYSMTMNFQQYVLVGSTVRSFLSCMKDKGELDVSFANNMMLWCAVSNE